MIYVTNIQNVKNISADEIWAIVRVFKSKTDKLKHVPELSPSPYLFSKFRNFKQNGVWGKRLFEEVYTPQFLNEMSEGIPKNLLNKLYKLDKEDKTIVLCCYCTDEQLCHRSIIAGILQGVGCNVQGVEEDYSFFSKEYKKILKEKNKNN